MKFSAEYMRQAARRPGIRATKVRSYELMNLSQGESAIDIGCGPGIDTVELANIVGPHGRIVGVDQDPDMITAAKAEAAAAGLSKRVEYHLSSGIALPLAEETFDACRCERLLQHLSRSESVEVVKEALRVLRPGGRIVFIDTDWPTLSIHFPNPDFERKVAGILLAHWKNSFAARGMRELFSRSGIDEIGTETGIFSLTQPDVDVLFWPIMMKSSSSGIVLPWQWEAWRSSLARLQYDKTFYATVNAVICYGKKVIRA